jgi:hypothetical protein
MHRRAREVFERLMELDPESWDVRRELARSQADSGAQVKAVEGLEKFGRKRVALRDFDAARTVFEEILALDASNATAAGILEEIESGAFDRRREQHQRAVRQAVMGLLAGLLVLWFYFEGSARRAYVAAIEDVFAAELIEKGNYQVAADVIGQVAQRFPWTTTGALDVPRHVALLRARAAGGRVPEASPDAGQKDDKKDGSIGGTKQGGG